jgi:O-methyltransferase involved in polyketide biosynthesis
MYLTPAEVEATLGVIARRSAAGSSLTVTYMSPAPLRWVVGFLMRRLGEPFKSAFTADVMRELLSRSGFRVVEDDDIFGIGRRLLGERARPMRIMKHQRVATAKRVARP